ncbi:polysaccharide biosynthesis C-terminal domain-containing protein [Marixanthomonas ophiurae]|uniref:NAD-dependent epimerase/dehydratase family protein n=1 Tax=Marixanthomonas ophiurae TaxID=387659 RepID=A0A3E1Q775_9FLAO|nr:NAD-dependent epimerase/dehydratase family protein [Marixanthomonas ophiurae]RFN57979.1 NAD-dependent epimerase/dehydratase family protein [Marixanthomonas ophiurae]
MIKTGITGQSGFMGQHVYNYLGTKPEQIECVDFKRELFNNIELLEKFVSSCDVIVHIAAMNRHENPQVIYDTNVGLVQKLIQACKNTGATPKIIFSSSTQEERDNLYGKSKRDGRKALEKWANEYGGNVISLVIPNVFGPFGKPFYNSVVATFCHQLNHNETPEIYKDGTVNLIYINELSKVFYNHIINQSTEKVELVTVSHTARKKVSEILTLLNSFKKNYVENGVVPNLTDSFEKALFNSFASYIPKDYFPRKYTKHSDNRGAFVEIMRANTPGQTSFSTTVPGITRGNHYHTRKVERFAVISGKASIKLRKINTDKVYEYHLDGSEPAYVDMPIWYTHNITNIGDTELITLFWINEPYNAEDPDTYFETV